MLATDATPEQLLADAEADLKATRDGDGDARRAATVKQALDEIATQHATPDTYMAEATQDAGAGHERSSARRIC